MISGAKMEHPLAYPFGFIPLLQVVLIILCYNPDKKEMS